MQWSICLSRAEAASLYYSGMFRLCACLLFVSTVLSPVLAWSDTRVPSFLIRIPESIGTVFVAETSTAKFHRFDHEDKRINHAGSQYMSIGQKGAGKEKNGDRRTPLGVYFVTEQLDTQRLHEKYGVTAFVLDYPNEWDHRQKRTGDGIWVHGVDPAAGERPPLDTDGCIALSNTDLAALEGLFLDNVTPVLIARDVEWRDVDDQASIATELETSLRRWSSSQVRGDFHAYLAAYDDSFERWNMSKSEWMVLNLKHFAKRMIQALSVNDLLILGYPDAEGIYLSRFRQTIVEGDRRRVSTKRLYWKRSEEGTFKIIAEDEG